MRSSITIPGTPDITLEELPLRLLSLAIPTRDVRMYRVEQLAADFDESGVGTLPVSRRRDGTVRPLDGQHRILTMRKLDYPAEHLIRCEVHHGLSEAEEDARVRRFNNRLVWSAIDDFNSAIRAGDAIANDINAVVIAHGYTIRRSMQPMSISCPKTLHEIYLAGGVGLVAQTLQVVSHAWGQDSASVRSVPLQGISAFILRNPNADLDRLARKLGNSGTADAFHGKVKSLRSVRGGKVSANALEVVETEYNSRKRK